MLGEYPFYGNEVHSDLYSKYQCQERKSSASSTASTSSSESSRYVGTKSMEMSRQVLANTLQKNWTDNFPNQTCCDDSLTNLSWLHNVNPIKINEQLSFTPFIGYPKDKFNPQMVSTRNVQVYPNQSSQWLNLPNPSQPQTLQEGTKYDQPDYKNNPHLKPPFSYAILISWAMKELGKPKITLSDIYNWIVENFAFYRYADSSWQNSIRHNLSLGKCFEKVPRKKDEPGKGGFWRINPQHTKTLEVNLSKIKYNPSNNQNYNNLSEPSFAKQRLMKQISSSNNSQYQPNSTSNTVKRSRKSPLTVTQEDWDSLETFSENTSRNFHYSTPAIRVTEPPFVDDPSTFNNTCFDLSPVDNSSSDSNYYGQSSDNDISMNNFDDQSLDDILNSPMLLDKEGLSTHDDFHLLTSTNEFSDLFFPSKDDLQELDSLLGIY